MLVAKTEHWNHFAKCRQDLFGLVDTMALPLFKWEQPMCIQTTSDDHRAEHRTKILKHKNTPILLRHVTFELWSWGTHGARGRRKLWKLHRTGFSIDAKGKVSAFESHDPLT
jgi:hypothetical protein